MSTQYPESTEPAEIIVTGEDEAVCRHEAEHEPVEGCECPCCARATEEAYRTARLRKLTQRMLNDDIAWRSKGGIDV